ncbi:acyl-CoA dehydrogenase family protein [Sporichthya polymorpha]|uniref:acyl-CoA dehydrogenase family protein n=1 Tax=Sporichthya polymorpha TaxID=35751 RepID=UPI0003720E70|nr:acyl-CoA dehydrogenase family protein [Sporichthya polymorpha]
MGRSIFEPEHEQVRRTTREFLDREALPHLERWTEQGHVDREIFCRAGEIGLLGMDVPTEYGGAGMDDYRYNVVVSEECARGGSGVGLTLQNDLIAPYIKSLGTEGQKKRFLTGITSGELLGCIAMSEPGAGSDLAGIRTSARRDGDDWVLNGSKTFISGGILADFAIVVTRTDAEAGHKGFTLFLVEDGMPGFAKGKKLDKIGNRASDTAELFFDNVRVPDANRLGEIGGGFYALMRNLPQERLGIAIIGLIAAERALEITMQYAKERTAFGQPIGQFQVNRHALSEMHTKLTIARVYIDHAIMAVTRGELSAQEAAGAKWWMSELEWEVVDRCMQMFGGYGYINEYEIAAIWRNSRVQRVYGGTTEILKDLVGRGLGF